MLCLTEGLLFTSYLKKLYEKKIRRMADCYGLTPNEVDILLFLLNNPGYDTAKDITEMLMLPKSCVSRSVDSLTRQGFLTSCEDERDRRVLHLSLLPAAYIAAKDAQASQKEFLSCIYRDFTPDEQEMLEHLMHKISTNIRDALEG